MGLALGIPVHGVCSLDALAEQALARVAPTSTEVLVATDARRKEVYWARYGRGDDGAVALTRAGRRPPGRGARRRAGRCRPSGAARCSTPDLFPHPLGQPLDVDPGWLGRVALRRLAAGAAMPVEPLYLRRPDALTTAERGAS